MTDIPDKASEIIRPSIETILEKFVDELTQQQRNYIADQFCRIVAAAPFMQEDNMRLAMQVTEQLRAYNVELRAAGTFASGLEAAAKVAEDYDGDGITSHGYFDQLGDASKTRNDIAAAIRAIKPPRQT